MQPHRMRTYIECNLIVYIYRPFFLAGRSPPVREDERVSARNYKLTEKILSASRIRNPYPRQSPHLLGLWAKVKRQKVILTPKKKIFWVHII
jgi:hypothetical protein